MEINKKNINIDYHKFNKKQKFINNKNLIIFYVNLNLITHIMRFLYLTETCIYRSI